MFVKELYIYLDYLKERITENSINVTDKQRKYLLTFTNNLNEGITYYQKLFAEQKERFLTTKNQILSELVKGRVNLNKMTQEIEKL